LYDEIEKSLLQEEISKETSNFLGVFGMILKGVNILPLCALQEITI